MSGTPKILVWDLENSPALGWFWGSTYKTDIIKVERPSSVMSFAAKWYGQRAVEYRSDYHDGHEAMVQRAWELLDEADAVVSYNGKQHDTPHMTTEIIAEVGKPPSPFVEIDLYRTVKTTFKFQQNRLNFVAQHLQIGAKVAHEGIGLWFKCMADDEAAWRKFRTYNIGDVRLTEQLYEKLLPWIKGHPHIGLLAGVEGDVCSKCGSEELERRGFAHTAVSSFQRFVCKKCGSWSRGAKAVSRADARGVS